MSELKQYADADGLLRQIPIFLLSDEIDEVIQAAYCWYAGRKIWARSDGKTVTWYGDPAAMRKLETPKVEPWDPKYLNFTDPKGVPIFKLHLIFHCVIQSSQGRWGGVYKFRSTSLITASQLLGSLIWIKKITGGYLEGIPLWLVVRPVQVSPAGQTITVHVVHCEIRGSDLSAIQQQAIKVAESRISQAKQLDKLAIEYRQLLSAPGDDGDTDLPDEVQQEYHPEGEAAIGGTRTEQVAAMLKSAALPIVPAETPTAAAEEFLSGEAARSYYALKEEIIAAETPGDLEPLAARVEKATLDFAGRQELQDLLANRAESFARKAGDLFGAAAPKRGRPKKVADDPEIGGVS